MKKNLFIKLSLLLLLVIWNTHAWAATLTQGQAIYAHVNNCGNWKKDGAVVRFELCNSSGTTLATINGTGIGSDYWYCEVTDADVAKVRLHRMKSDWSADWGQSAYFAVESGKNCIELSEYDWSWNNCTWSALTSNTIYVTPAALTYSNSETWNSSTRTLKANIKIGGSEYIQRTMQAVGKTYNGNAIYKTDFFATYSGVHVVQFQLYSGSTWKGQHEFDKANNSWDFGPCLTNISDHIYTSTNTWVAYTYDITVSFNLQGHGSAISSQTILKGGTAEEPDDPEADGWTFGGWYEEAECSNKWNFASAITSEGKTLYAKWTAKTYTVTLDSQTPTNEPTESVTATYASAMPAIGTAPTKTGYTAGGFWTGKAGTGTQYYTNAWASARNYDIAGTTTLYAKWTQTVTLNANTSYHGSGDNKSATATWNGTSLSGFSATGAADGYHVIGYYSDPTEGVKVLNADGTFAASDVTDYITSGKWTKAGATTLYAHLSAHEWALYHNSGGTKLGDFVDRGSNVYTLNLNIANGTNNDNWSLKLDGETMYEFPSSSPIGTARTLSTGSTYRNWSGASYGNYTLKIYYESSAWKLIANASPQISFTASPTGGTVSASAEIESTISSGAYITYNTEATFTATPSTGYTLDGWYGASDFSGEKLSTSNPLEIPSITSNTARYAKFNETMSTLSTSNSYDAGNPGYDAPTVAGSATTIGYATTRTITAAAAGIGYALSSWTITNGTRTDGGAVNASSITVRSNGDGAAVTVRANYTEVLTTNWVLKGGSEFGGTAWSTEHALTKKSGHSTEPIAYWTVNMTNTTSTDNDNFNFKIVKKGVSDTYYGLPADGDEFWYLRSTGEQTMSVAKNIQLHADMTGDYEIKVDYTDEDNPKITVTFPMNGQYNVTLTKSGHGSVANEGTLEIHQEPKVAISATPEAGYRFTGWTVDSDHSSYISFDNASSASTNVWATSASAAGATITANFGNSEIIYFDANNIVNEWGDKAYVTFFSSNFEWDGTNGSLIVKNWVDDALRCVEMTRIGDSHTYYLDYSNLSGHSSVTQYVVFTSKYFSKPGSGNYVLYDMAAVTRGDYSKSTNNMCVAENYREKDKNRTGYYCAYWMNYNDDKAGIKLKVYSGGGAAIDVNKDFESIAVGSREYTASVTLSANTTYSLSLLGDNGTWYNNDNSGTMVNTNCTAWPFVDRQKSPGHITTTAGGTYKFTLNCADKLYLTADYPLAVGDYQVVFNGKVAVGGITERYPSSVIRHIGDAGTKKDTVSFFVVNGDSWTLQLQRCSNIDPITWVNVGSAKTAADFSSPATGIYNFVVQQDSTAPTPVTPAFASLTPELYTGDFYIRSDAADGGWEAYRKAIDNKMNYSNYSKQHSNFDYYHCKYKSTGTNVKFCIANDYSVRLSDTLYTDTHASTGEGILPYQANIRFMWNSATNVCSRAYLNGSSDGTAEYLKIASDPTRRSTTSATKAERAEIVDKNGALMVNNDTTFEDLGNWVYQIDLKALEGARVKLTSNYRYSSMDHLQYFKGAEGDWSNAKTEQILGGSANAYHSLRIVYDFKTNHMLSAWLVDDDTEVDGKRAINTDVMILRSGHDDAKQITFTEGSELDDVDTVYTALELKKSHILGNGSQASKEFYWVSFPYNVKINDIFGSVGNFNIDWAIQYYNGKKRAKNGYWVDSEPNWEFFESDTATLKANEGYVLTLALSKFLATGSGSKWDNDVDSLYLYFPSAGKVGTILETNVTLKMDTVGYTCTIDRRSQAEKDEGTNNINKNRTVADSHWHCIGIPSFANASRPTGSSWTTSEGESSAVTDEDDIPNIDKWTSPSLLFLYAWDKETNKLSPVTASSYTFKAMHAYLVQYGNDTIQWKAVSTPSSIVARRRAAIQAQEFRLEISKNEVVEDQTFIRFADNEGVTAGFEFGQDLSKEFNKNSANIYTFADYVPVAGNSMPLDNEQTTVLPMGVQIAANGEYTFAMPEGTNGIGVVLLDNIAGTRTNLGLTDYTVNLNAGTYDERFVLEISPIQYIPTDIEETEVGNQNSAIRKVMADGILYIVKDGKVFDAQGRQVK